MNSHTEKYALAYAMYAVNPQGAECTAKMCDAILNISHAASPCSDKIMEIRRAVAPVVHGGTRCMTNGSTKTTPEHYVWGPNFQAVADSVWRYMHRFWDVGFRYYLSVSHSNSITIKGSWCESDAILRVNPKTCTDKLIRKERVAYIVSPSTLHELLRYDRFCEMLRKTAAVVSVTEMDPTYYDLTRLVQTGVPMTVQMRSWREGTAFSTCPYGVRHFMENLFHVDAGGRLTDLLNFSESRPLDGKNPDAIWPLEQEFRQCQCGTWYRPMNFEPHASNGFMNSLGHHVEFLPFAPILRDLICENDWAQVIQERTGRDFTLHVPVAPRPGRVDAVRMFAYFVYGADVKVQVETTPFLLGHRAKKPLFWSLAKAEELQGVRRYAEIRL